jgi:tetratricopeptide (TPR) repeat protein
LYGKRPFGGATLKQHALEMATGRVPGAPSGSQVPGWVHEVLVRGLATDPAQRWPDMNVLLAALRPRSERGRGVTLGLVALVLLALVGIGYGVATRQRLMVCGGQERALAGLWDKPTRERLRGLFSRSGLAFQGDAWKGVETTVDAWALDWVATARDACEATRVRKTDSAELLALRRTCLDERLQELRAMVSVLEAPDREVVLNAPFAAKSLQSPLTCMARTRAVVTDERSQQADAALRAHLNEAFALFNAGKYEPAAAVLKPALEVSAPARTMAEGFLLLGRIEHRRHDQRAATLAHRAAMEHALESGEAGLEAMAASRLSADEAPGVTDDEADLFDRLAQAAASRAADDWEVTVELARNESFLELRRHRDRPALTHLERALTVQREHLPPTHPDLATTLNNIGLALTRLRQFDDAIRTYQQALAIHEQAEGPLHPNTATSAHNLGATLLVVGRAVDARVALTQALEARRQSLGTSDPETLATQLLLARACTSLGLLDEASALLVDLRHAHDGEAPSRALASVVEAEADLELVGHYWKEARAHALDLAGLASALDDPKLRFTAAVLQARAAVGLGSWVDATAALAEAERGRTARDEREQVELDEARARLDFAQGRFAEARAAWVRAVALREPSSLGRAAHAAALVELARTLVELGQLAEAHARLGDAVALLESTQFAADQARAKVVLAAVQALEADGGEASSVPEDAALSAVERVALGAWLKAHGLAFRAAIDG